MKEMQMAMDKKPIMPAMHPQNDMSKHSNADVEAMRAKNMPMMKECVGYSTDRGKSK